MNALVPMPVMAAPIEAASAELFTAHDTGVEAVALVHDPKLPWVVRKGGRLPTILEPRYQTQAEAECAALGLNHAQELGPGRELNRALFQSVANHVSLISQVN
jgi:hypothetical protein